MLLEHHPLPEGGNDEEWLGSLFSNGVADALWYGDFVAAHFAFSNHEAELLETDLLEKFSSLATELSAELDSRRPPARSPQIGAHRRG